MQSLIYNISAVKIIEVFSMQTLTIGSPRKVILKFAFPIFAGNILQQIYQIVDNIIVGQFLGNNAFTAVGATYGIFFLISGFVWGITSGFTVLTAQKYGQSDHDGTRHTIGVGIVLSALLTAAMTVLTVTTMLWILRTMNTPENIYDDAYAYIIVICLGLGAQMFYNLLAGILRAIGNSKIPLFFLIIASVLNIVLDILFIVPLKMGVVGAALATVISQGFSAILCLLYILIKIPYLHLHKKDLRWDKEIIRKELSIGIPMALQYAITSIGMLVIQASLNLLEAVAITAYTVGNKIEIILEQGAIAIGSAMSTYTAQNWGARKIHRISQGIRAAIVLVLAYFLLAGTLTAFGGKYLTYLLISEDIVHIIGNVDMFLKVVSATGILLGILCIYRNCVQGMGHGTVSLMGGLLELFARGIVAVLTVYTHSFLCVCMGYPIAWLLADIFFVYFYYFVAKKKAALQDGQE